MFKRSLHLAVLISLVLGAAAPSFARQDTTTTTTTTTVESTTAQEAQAVADAVLALKIKTALLDKIGWEATPINVDAKTGTVWLTGKVKSRATIGTAEEIVKAMPEVKSLKNVLELEGATGSKVTQAVHHAQSEVDDAVLESRVKMHLLQQMGKVAFSIEVEANGGIVTLTGHVPDDLRHTLAVKVATEVSGVTKLVDLLEVRS